MPKTPKRALSRTQLITQRAFATLERFVHIEAVSGIVLLAAAALALLWANSPWAASYHALWHAPLSFGIGEWSYSQSLHFWINDALMTLFFLVVGMEIRREIHEGALSKPRQAMLPIIAAIGGVIVPALIYVALNDHPGAVHGWAVPTATDIAFAVGVLALLGPSIPSNVRVLLLALAIIDDIIAVLIIALFYSGGLEASGFVVAGMGIILVLLLQRMGIGSALAYILPGAVIWFGMLLTGAHPTLAGVVLGLMTPVLSAPMRERPLDALARLASDLAGHEHKTEDEHKLAHSLKEFRLAQRELLPPVVRVQQALHPWVAFLVMPLFALANAGVSIDSGAFSAAGSEWVMLGIGIALVAGKPLGVVGASWLAVRLGISRLPAGVTWRGVWLVGLLAGIGFTMSIFIAMLAFDDAQTLNAAKLGVLAGSFAAALLGLAWGFALMRRRA